MDKNVELIKYEKLSTKEKMILYFFIYAFIGWCLETIYAFMVFGNFVKRGFLFGPICPIYGFGAILLIINLRKIKNNNWIKFLVSMIIFTIFELIASWILEIFFNQRWWDYSDAFLNFQGRICLIFSLIWGVIGVLFANVLHPYIKKKTERLLHKVSFKTQKNIIYLCSLIFILDSILSIIKNI